MIASNITGAAAYAAILGQNSAGSSSAPAAGNQSFSDVMQGAISSLTDLGHNADQQSAQALVKGGNLTDVVMAVSKAEMALQATVAVRDKVVSAYQDIMRMAV